MSNASQVKKIEHWQIGNIGINLSIHS